MKRFGNSSFAIFFRKFPQLLLAGAIFSAFFSAFTALSFLAANLSGFYNIIIIGLGIIPSALFLPGLVMVSRKYGVEKQFVPVLKTFFASVRENFKPFILHGFVIYFIIACSTFAIMYYGVGALVSSVYSMVLIIYVLFTMVLMVALFYLPLMSVTYSLRLRDLYKNSILLVFGTILRNIGALAYTIFIGGVAFLCFLYTDGVFRYITLALVVLLCPLLICYGTTAIISKGMQENVGPFVGVQPVKKEAVTDDDIIAASELRSDDDYIFVNGKMVKNPNKEEAK